MTDKRDYWFPAKRYGWGWGVPATWQGWTVMAAFIVLLIAGARVVIPRYGPGAYTVYSLVLAALLVLVCWWKGEPPRWRWGGE